jgi:hypothetical protein
MDVGTTVIFIVKMALLTAVAVIILWWPVSRFLGRFQFSGGSHDIDLAYLISKEDRDSLTREEYKLTEQMSYPELKTYLKERFPNSIPEFGTDD